MQIFKGLGRFQSPLEQPEAYKLNFESPPESDTSSGSSDSEKSAKTKEILTSLMLSKPAVVLEHLKSARTLPLSPHTQIKQKIVQSVSQQLSQVKIGYD